MADEDEEGELGGKFENGHWVWDDKEDALVFVSDLPLEVVESLVISTKVPTGKIQFKDDIDLIEQQRFRRRYQRKIKPGEPDVVILQDVKDIALYTAPLALLSPALINLLHLPTTERFLRALLFYCQYYLQVAEEMTTRILELQTKIRTPESEVVEAEFRDNLSDLRLLVAKEYCTMLVGAADIKNFHHMGPEKKSRSLSDKDARLIETLLRMSIQIVWIALGRNSFDTIEVEVNRLFKSEIFNSAEHAQKSQYYHSMTPEEKNALLGSCLHPATKLSQRSPLLNEVFCHRDIDYRIFGLGVIKYPVLPPRLRYLKDTIVAPEENMEIRNLVLGILGTPRSTFDTMLIPLPTGSTTTSESKSKTSVGMNKSIVGKSVTSKKSSATTKKLYNAITIPTKDTTEEYPESFPEGSEEIRQCSETQRKKWVNRYIRLLHPSKGDSKTKRKKKG